MSKLKILKIFLTGLLIIAGVVLLYLVISAGEAKSVLLSYDSLKTENTSGFSRKVSFLETYTRSTGDITLATSLGVDKEQAEKWKNGVIDDPTAGDSGIVRPPLSGTWQDQLTALKNSGSSDASHFNNSNFKIVNINGQEFISENQNGQYPNTYDSNNTVSSHGCFLFAMSAILSNKTGQVVTVADMMRKDGASVSYNGMYGYSAPNNNKFNLDGSDDAAGRILSMFNVNNGIVPLVENQGQVCSDFHTSVKNAIDSGYYVLYYCYGGNGVLSSSGGSGNHWTVIVGYDDNNYKFLCNGDRSNSVSKTTVRSKCQNAYVIK